MKISSFLKLSAIFFITFSHVNIFASSNVKSVNPRLACDNEKFSQEMAEGRIDWALNCGFIDLEDANFHRKLAKFPIFFDENEEQNAPTDVDSPCESWHFSGISCPVFHP